MNSQRLAYFVAVVDHGGFTAAARAVYVSQPALSLAVKELEMELGTPLFDRVGRGVRLTSAGEALLGPARQVALDLESGRSAVAAVTGLLTGSLALASLPTLAVEPMAWLVGRFRRHHPGIRVDLTSPEDSQDLFKSVTSGSCELGLTDARAVPAALTVVDLGPQELVLILPPGSPAGDDDDGPVDLGSLPFVVSPVGTSSRRLLDEHLEAAGVVPRLAVESAQRDALLPLVLAGAGAALVPEPMARMAATLGAVVVPLRPPAVRSLGLVHRGGELSPAAARFVELATG